MKTPRHFFMLGFLAMAGVGHAVPPDSPNSSILNRPPSSSPSGNANAAKVAAQAAEASRQKKVETLLVRAEITVDDQGKPTDVKLLNPTDDKAINQKLTNEIRRRRFSPPQDSSEPTAGTFTVTVRVQVEG